MGARFGLGRRSPALLRVGVGALVLRAPPGADGFTGGAEHTLDSPGIDAACAALRGLLAGHDKAPVAVQLACGWCRLLLLPAMEALITEERWRTYAQARFEQVFGDTASGWELQVAHDAPGRARIVVAWPLALRETLAQHRNVQSVRVGLLENLGLLLRHEPDFSGCLIEIEGDGAGFLLLHGGMPRRVRWCRFDDDDGLSAAVRSEWANVQASESLVPGGEPGLAVAPPIPPAGSARAATIGALATRLSFERVFSLPEWP